MAYSTDLRERVARAHADWNSSAEVAETFGYSELRVRRVSRRLREAGCLESRSTARTDDDADQKKILALIEAKPDLTLAEVAEAIGEPVSPGSVSRTLKRLNLPRKTKAIRTIAALSVEGIVASASFDGGTTAARSVGFVKDKLCPALRDGQVVVPDNLAAHNGRRVDALTGSAGCVVPAPPAVFAGLQPDRERDLESKVDPAKACKGEAR